LVDSNVLLDVVDREAEMKRAITHDLLARDRFGGLCLCSQVPAELLNVIRSKQTRAMPRARSRSSSNER
jgi:predicted nucleic acid-binding protein